MNTMYRLIALSALLLFLALPGTTWAQATDLVCDKCVNTSDIALDAVTSNRIKNGTIRNADIAPDAISGGRIKNGTLTNADIAPNSISGNRIKNGSIKAIDIADGPRSGLDADTVDGMQASALIAAGQDEVRTPIDTVPVTITTPGSYYLTGDLTVSTINVNGIHVAADDVTIDLMGFSLIGPGSGAGGTGSGIFMDGRRNVSIQNGTVREFAYFGIHETNLNDNGQGHRVINMRVIENGSSGILLRGRSHLIKDCTAGENANTGIAALSGSTVTGNTAYDNGNDGISVSAGSAVTNNTSYNNGWNGIDPVFNNLVMGNTAYGNNQSGIGYSNIQSCPNCTFVNNHAP